MLGVRKSDSMPTPNLRLLRDDQRLVTRLVRDGLDGDERAPGIEALIRYLSHTDLSREEVASLAWATNRFRCRPPLDDEVVATLLRSEAA
jgi:hypothetical protein